MARICDLPKEVVEEIMSWMSPESLRQFKCVNKSWHAFINALFSNPAFVAKHLENMKKKMLSSRFLQFSNLMTIDSPLEQEESENTARYLLTLASDDNNNSDYIPTLTEDMAVLDECNGIICLEVVSGIFLLNPALREIKFLPAPGLEVATCVGFGYNSRADDYKVVIIECGKAKVYTLSTNSWKEINLDIEVNVDSDCCTSVYWNGVYYWCYWGDNGLFTITSFDFGDDVFRNISLPDYLQREILECVVHYHGLIKIDLWNESLVILCLCQNNGTFIDLWVMDFNISVAGAQEVSSSWTKHLTIGPLVGIRCPLVFWGNELYLKAESKEIVSYNLNTQELTHHSVRLESFWWILIVYVKSLVSVLKKAGRNSTVEMIDPASGSTFP